MIGGVTRRMLPHLSGVPHLHVNRPLVVQPVELVFVVVVVVVFNYEM